MVEPAADLPSYLCCVRPFESRDTLAVKLLVSEAATSTVQPSFVAALFRETLWEALIVTMAALFVVFGVPGDLCLMMVPAFFAFLFGCIWTVHQMKAMAAQGDLANVRDTYQNSSKTNFWVAELYEPLTGAAARYRLMFVTPADVTKYAQDLTGVRRVVVGTCAVRRNRDRDEPDGGWLTRMAVLAPYRRHGIGTQLLHVAERFCGDAGHSSLRLQTTECHDAAKSIFYKNGFQILNYMHKPLFAGVKVGVYLFTKRVKGGGQSVAA